jgi:hypothetical protein
MVSREASDERFRSDAFSTQREELVIAGYHLVFGAYGFWLPNDPRGSYSDFIGSIDLYLAGGVATKINDRHSVANRPHNHTDRLKTKESMLRPPVKFTGIQARAIGHGFETYFKITGYPVWAYAILPSHVHLALGHLPISVERLTIQLKSAATKQMLAEKCHPFGSYVEQGRKLPKCFVRGQWSRFLVPEDVAGAIKYVEDNPVRQGLQPQQWRFVKSAPSALV